jgi:hypothetical protein
LKWTSLLSLRAFKVHKTWPTPKCQPGNRLQTPILIGCKFLMIPTSFNIHQSTWAPQHLSSTSTAVISEALQHTPVFRTGSTKSRFLSCCTQ